jgi:hypothetical protein
MATTIKPTTTPMTAPTEIPCTLDVATLATVVNALVAEACIDDSSVVGNDAVTDDDDMFAITPVAVSFVDKDDRDTIDTSVALVVIIGIVAGGVGIVCVRGVLLGDTLAAVAVSDVSGAGSGCIALIVVLIVVVVVGGVLESASVDTGVCIAVAHCAALIGIFQTANNAA